MSNKSKLPSGAINENSWNDISEKYISPTHYFFFHHRGVALGQLSLQSWEPPRAKFMEPTWDPSGSCRPQMSPMLAPWTLLSGKVSALQLLYMGHIAINAIHNAYWKEFNYSAVSALRLGRKFKYPDSKVHGVNMGPIWGRQDPGGPHVGPVNFAIWVYIYVDKINPAHQGFRPRQVLPRLISLVIAQSLQDAQLVKNNFPFTEYSLSDTLNFISHRQLCIDVSYDKNVQSLLNWLIGSGHWYNRRWVKILFSICWLVLNCPIRFHWLLV